MAQCMKVNGLKVNFTVRESTLGLMDRFMRAVISTDSNMGSVNMFLGPEIYIKANGLKAYSMVEALYLTKEGT